MTAKPLTELEQRIVDAVDTEALVETTRALVRIPSDRGNETPAQEAVARHMADLGLAVDRWEIDLSAVQRHPAASWEIERERALGVVGSIGGANRGRTLVLNGHVDVVPPGEESEWTHPPFSGSLLRGRIHGRGSLDMKGPLLAGLHALAAIRSAGVELTGRALLHSVVGEEDGGIGTLASILRGHTGDAAIVMEPTRLGIAPVQSGCVNFRLTVHGRAAHGAIRTEGVSALEKLIPLFWALRQLEFDRNASFADQALYSGSTIPFPICVGTVQGGSWASSVPERVVVEGRLGVLPAESMPEARGALETAIRRAAEADPFLREVPPTVEWWGGRFYPVDTRIDDPIVTTIASASADLTGMRPVHEAVPFGADAGLFAHVAAMPVVLFGAGDIREAHAPDESIDVGDLVKMSRILALTVARFCGVAE